MNRSDDYLWDGTGAPDPEVQRLERLLGRFRYRAGAAEVVELRPGRRWPRRLAVAAALLAGAGALALWLGRQSPVPAGAAWEVERLSGAPAVASIPIGASGRLPVGQWLETDSSSRARIDVPGIGFVEVEPRTRIGLKSTGPKEHRMALEYGGMSALVAAPPRLFFVETPAATAVDLGCAYRLQVDRDGRGLLHVTLGYVALEGPEREVVVPARALCETRPGRRLGTPYVEVASEGLRRALRRFDFEGGGALSLQVVLAEAREADDLTLWHLARSVDGPAADSVRRRMAQLRLDLRRPRHWEGLLSAGR
jgi:hypothetical protein